jgi:lysophospholipase L1-like esterase
LLLGLLAMLGGAVGRVAAQTVPPVQAVFQPGFHQALRGSHWSSRVTYRMKVPVGRGGGRVRVSFRAGQGSMRLHAASVALAGKGGALASAPVRLTFNGGQNGATAQAYGRVTSDPVSFAVPVGAEVAVSFEVEGVLAASTIRAFPDSYARSGSRTMDQVLGGSPFTTAVALDTIDVEGPPDRAFVAIGDSITEGYVDEANDYRNAWPAVAERLLKQPVVNAGVSGQGIWEELQHVDREVLAMEGITDCVVLLGTNDLSGLEAAELTSRLEQLFTRLAPACRVWAATLLPKERTSSGSLSTVNARRRQVNEWIRTQAKVAGVIDLEAAVRSPTDPNRFVPEYRNDGIHPSVGGQRKMGELAARVLMPLKLTASQPDRALIAGGEQVTLSGTGFFRPGLAVTFGGVPATAVTVVSPTSLTAKVPAHTEGVVDVVVTTSERESATLPGGFTYERQVVPPDPPRLTGVQPPFGPVGGGTAIRVSGAGFVEGTTVMVGGVPATEVRVEGPDAISAKTPAHAAGLVEVQIRTPDGQTAQLAGYEYRDGPRPEPTPKPELTGLAPRSGRPGDVITLSGQNFVSGAVVTFDGVRAAQVTVDGPTSARVTAPVHAPGPVTVVVTNPDGQSATLAQAFTYAQPVVQPPPPLPTENRGCGSGALGTAAFMLFAFVGIRRGRAGGR